MNYLENLHFLKPVWKEKISENQTKMKYSLLSFHFEPNSKGSSTKKLSSRISNRKKKLMKRKKFIVSTTITKQSFKRIRLLGVNTSLNHKLNMRLVEDLKTKKYRKNHLGKKVEWNQKFQRLVHHLISANQDLLLWKVVRNYKNRNEEGEK